MFEFIISCGVMMICYLQICLVWGLDFTCWLVLTLCLLTGGCVVDCCLLCYVTGFVGFVADCLGWYFGLVFDLGLFCLFVCDLEVCAFFFVC